LQFFFACEADTPELSACSFATQSFIICFWVSLLLACLFECSVVDGSVLLVEGLGAVEAGGGAVSSCARAQVTDANPSAATARADCKYLFIGQSSGAENRGELELLSRLTQSGPLRVDLWDRSYDSELRPRRRNIRR
jgi:hypothetical protein